MTPLTLCAISHGTARDLMMAPKAAGGWVAVEEIVSNVLDRSLGYRDALLALLPSDWSEAQRHPISPPKARLLLASLEDSEASFRGGGMSEFADQAAIWVEKVREALAA